MSKKERWIQHYRSSQMILLVGEGDFSFSACLARAFGSAVNMVATSLDSEETLLKKHWSCVGHLEDLEKRGCLVLHEVDVHDMNQHPSLVDMKFDIIIFNFPHAGHISWLCEKDTILIERHKKLLGGFFRSAGQMLIEGGEIHVTHRDDHPYNEWEVEKQAQKEGLILKEKVPFRKECYSGYHNKRGSFIDGNKKFPIENPFTFKFIIAHDHRNQETTSVSTISTLSDHQETTTTIDSNTDSDHDQVPVLSDHDQMHGVTDQETTIWTCSKTESDHQMPVDQLTPGVGDHQEAILITSSKSSSGHQTPVFSKSNHDQMPSVGDPHETTFVSGSSSITTTDQSDDRLLALFIHQVEMLVLSEQMPLVGDHQEMTLKITTIEPNHQVPGVDDNEETTMIGTEPNHQVPTVGDNQETKLVGTPEPNHQTPVGNS